LATPNHPEYPSAHGSITSAIVEVVTEFLGTKQIDVTIHGSADGTAGNLSASRHFATADDLREEIVNARVWAGLHYRRSSDVAVALGAKVAHYALNHGSNRPTDAATALRRRIHTRIQTSQTAGTVEA